MRFDLLRRRENVFRAERNGLGLWQRAAFTARRQIPRGSTRRSASMNVFLGTFLVFAVVFVCSHLT